LDKDDYLDLSDHIEVVFNLKIINLNSTPAVRLENGGHVVGERIEDNWNFIVPMGIHQVVVDDLTFSVQVSGDTIFNPQLDRDELFQVTVKIFSVEGDQLKDFVATVKTEEDVTWSTVFSSDYSVKLFLPKGVYSVFVEKPPFSGLTSLEVLGDSEINLRLLTIRGLTRAPMRFYNYIETYTRIERSDATLNLIIGLSTEALLASISTLFILSLVVVGVIQKGVILAAKDHVLLLYRLGAGRSEFMRILGLPTLLFGLCLSTLSGYISWWLNPVLFNNLTVIGYGVFANLEVSILYTIFLYVVSWLYSILRMPEWILN